MIFMAGNSAYSLVHEHKNGWNLEIFRERYSEVLERYDYIVGDWGYEQLRLRGFFREGHPRAGKDCSISSLVDYINEYCNFGCAYFVLNKVDRKSLPPEEQEASAGVAEAIVALNEAGEQAAETAAAAASNGPIVRWPLKERAGSPVRVPNITVSALARAQADAERRQASANAGTNASQDAGHHGNPIRNSTASQQQAASPNQHHRNNRSQHANNTKPSQAPPPKANRTQQGSRAQETAMTRNSEASANPVQQDGARNDSRWPGKTRRRKPFGGKPGPRSAEPPRSEADNSGGRLD